MMDVIASRQVEKAGRDYQVLIEKPRCVGELEFACRWSAVDDAGIVVGSHDAHGEDTAAALMYAVLSVGIRLGPEFTYSGEEYAGFPRFQPADGPGRPGSYFFHLPMNDGLREEAVQAEDAIASREPEKDGRKYQVLIEKPRRMSGSGFACHWSVTDDIGVVVESREAYGEDSAAALICVVLSVGPCLGPKLTWFGEEGAGFPCCRPDESGKSGSWFPPFADKF